MPGDDYGLVRGFRSGACLLHRAAPVLYYEPSALFAGSVLAASVLRPVSHGERRRRRWLTPRPDRTDFSTDRRPRHTRLACWRTESALAAAPDACSGGALPCLKAFCIGIPPWYGALPRPALW